MTSKDHRHRATTDVTVPTKPTQSVCILIDAYIRRLIDASKCLKPVDAKSRDEAHLRRGRRQAGTG
jgi:hypothetical protein